MDGQELTSLSPRDLRMARRAIGTVFQSANLLRRLEVLAQTHWPLTAVHPVFQWAYPMYSQKYDSINALPNGASLALLNDPANTAQALWLLQRAGKITFKPGTSPWYATTADIASDPHNYDPRPRGARRWRPAAHGWAADRHPCRAFSLVNQVRRVCRRRSSAG